MAAQQRRPTLIW